MYVRDLEGNEFILQATTTHDLELNGNQNISFKVLPTKVNNQFIEDLTEMWEVVDDNDVTHKIIYCKKRGEGNQLTVDVKAIPLFFDSFDTERIYEEYNEHMTAVEYFNLVFSGSGFNYVLLGTFYAIQWQGVGEGDTRLELFKNGLNRYKAEFYISGNTVYLDNQIGRDTQFMYRYRLNASNITQENDASTYWTYAKGFGDFAAGEEQSANLEREYTSPIASIVGIRHAPPIYNGNITTNETMDEQLKVLVDESLKISVSTDVHDLRKQGYALAQPELGDRVFLMDERIGLDKEVRVNHISIVRDWKGNVLDLKLTLGSPGIVRRHQSNLQTAVSRITELIEGRRKLPFSVLDNAVAEATKALQSAQTELSFSENGILAVDKDNLNNVVLFNSSGIGVSTDGGATFNTAMTGEGVIAESIIGQSIIGVNLASVTGEGVFHVNGPNAEFINSNGILEVSPNGIYFRDETGSLRYQMDDEVVNSAALGTSNNNVYLASDNETRSVYYESIPGDGVVESYLYTPVRARGFYGNFINFNSALSGESIYIRPLSGGEVRVTRNETTDDYLNFRASTVFGHTLDLNSFSTTSDNLYIRTADLGEVRVTRVGSTTSYKPLRASGFYGDFIDVNAADGGENVYIRPVGGSEVKATVQGTTETYVPVRASSFPTGSLASTKTDIQVWNESVLDKYRNDITVYDYKLNAEVAVGKHRRRQGLVIGEGHNTPVELIDGDGTEQYLMNSWNMKAIQELIAEVDTLKARVKELENDAV